MPAALTFVASIAACWVVMRLARRLGLLARPRPDRWSQRPTALLGGLGFAPVFLVALLAVHGAGPRAGLLAAVGLALLIGLADDLYGLSPARKIFGQLLCALALYSFGGGVSIPGGALLELPATMVWVVMLANAFNLADNMDGLAAGLALIAALWLALTAWGSPAGSSSLLLACAAAGFLVWNFPPARVFMGDCGSHALGVALAALSAEAAAGGGGLAPLVPLLVVALPLFDTLFVTLTRRQRGQSPFQGGKDHLSHRLVAWGLSERAAVLVLYLLAAALGGIGWGLSGLDLLGGLGAVLGSVLFLALFGLFLAEAPVPYARGRRVLPAVLLLGLLDALAVWVAFLAAYLLRFEGEIPSGYVALVVESLPGLVAIKLAVFAATGVYGAHPAEALRRTAWRLVRANGLAVLACVSFATLAFRFEDFSRAVFVIDGALCLLAMLAVRSALSLFQSALGLRRARRCLFVGPEALYGLVQEAPGRLVWVGRADAGSTIEQLLALTAEGAVEWVVVPPDSPEELRVALRRAGLRVQSLRLEIDDAP